MILSIVLRKEVETVEQAEALLFIVKTKLLDYPEIAISGQLNIKLDSE